MNPTLLDFTIAIQVFSKGFPGDSVVKNHLPMQELQVRFLGQENHLEKKMAAHCSILALENPRTERPGRLQSVG